MRSIIKLSADDRPASCAVCVFSRTLSGLSELSCAKSGIVAADYVCKRFELDITAKTARRRRAPDTARLSPDDFEI